MPKRARDEAGAEGRRPVTTGAHLFVVTKGEQQAGGVGGIVRDAAVWGGRAVIEGTRIPVFVIVDQFAASGTIAGVLDAYPELKPAAVIHHGVDTSQFSFHEKPDDYVCYLGRFTPGKGPIAAIAAARALGLRLMLAGPPNDYFHQKVEPLLDGTREAVRNWLVRLGWSHGDQEIFSREEIAELFSLEEVGRSAAQVDEGKLVWLNQHWLRALPRERLLEAAAPFLAEVAGGPVAPTPELARLVDLLRERSRTLRELAERARFALVETLSFDEAAVRKHLTPDASAPLRALRARLADLGDWSEPALSDFFQRQLLAALQESGGDR